MSVYAAAITLFLVMDPLGNIPIFLSVLRDVPEERRRAIIVREMLIALVVLAVFLFFGRYILAGLQISEESLRIGGGTVLFLIALRMIFPPRPSYDGDLPEAEPLVVPLAVPLVAGPSAMATVVLFATQHPDRLPEWFISLGVAWIASAVVLTGADGLRKRLGNRGIAALERLMGMILITLSVEMLLDGIAQFAEKL